MTSQTAGSDPLEPDTGADTPLADALDEAVARLQQAIELATTAHLEYVRQCGNDRSWRRLNERAQDEIRQRRVDVGLYAAGTLSEALTVEAEDARVRFPGIGMAGEQLPPVPPSEEPRVVREWWDALDADGRELVLLRATAWAGRTDGLPMRVRHEANMRILEAEIERRGDLLHPETGEPSDEADEQEARDLRGLLRLKAVLGGDDDVDPGVGTPHSERFLYLLDARRYPLKSAVVLGDLDEATHVVIQVPGATTTVDHRLVRELTWMSSLRNEMTRLLADDDARVAVVDWIGYHAPYDIAVRRSLGDSGMKILVPGEASDERYARDAAPYLARALDGLRALRPDARIVGSGHSYGASALGLALRSTSACDAVVVAGCPGMFASSLEELGLTKGQLWVAVAPGDLVAVLGMFGGDPHKIPGARRISPIARATTYPDGQWVLLRPPVGHESYYGPGTTTLFHIAAAAAGVVDKVKTIKA